MGCAPDVVVFHDFFPLFFSGFLTSPPPPVFLAPLPFDNCTGALLLVSGFSVFLFSVCCTFGFVLACRLWITVGLSFAWASHFPASPRPIS